MDTSARRIVAREILPTFERSAYGRIPPPATLAWLAVQILRRELFSEARPKHNKGHHFLASALSLA